MKKIIPLLLTALILLVSCGAQDAGADTDTAAPATVTENPHDTTNWTLVEPDPFAMIDYENPLKDGDVKSLTLKYTADGSEHTSSYAIPALTVDLEGANAMNAAMEEDLKGVFGQYFDELEKAGGETGNDYFMTVTYDCSIRMDVVSVIVRIATEYLDASREPSVTYRVYYYDALVDVQLDMFDYISYTGLAYVDVLEAISEHIDGVTENSEFYIVNTSEDQYDIYYLGTPDAHRDSAEVINIYIEPVDFDFALGNEG